MKRACIFDLDNTIYPVASIGDEMFAPVFRLIERSGQHEKDLPFIKRDIMRKPFQKVADHYHFSDALKKEGIDLLKSLTYEKQIRPFEDYEEIRKLAADRFLVTMGFHSLQRNKIDKLGIAGDFKEIHIVDPVSTVRTKKEVFAEIMTSHGYTAEEVIVIGDDPDSEIKAATELGIETVLYDRTRSSLLSGATYTISSFKELIPLVSK